MVTVRALKDFLIEMSSVSCLLNGENEPTESGAGPTLLEPKGTSNSFCTQILVQIAKYKYYTKKYLINIDLKFFLKMVWVS